MIPSESTVIDPDTGAGVLRPGGLTLTRRLIEEGKLKAGDKILDAGCGTGTTAAYLIERGFQTVGIDSASLRIETAERLCPGGRFIVGSGMNLPFPDGEFSAVISECSMSLMPDKKEAVKEWCRVLKSGGKFLLSDLYLRREECSSKSNEGSNLSRIARAMRKADLEKLLRRSGLEIIFFNDCSETLIDFAVHVILNNEVCEGAVRADRKGCGFETILDAETLSQKPGYFILVAEKKPAYNERSGGVQ